MKARIVMLIPCPRWGKFLKAVSRKRFPAGQAPRFWERECRDCNRTIAVTEEAMQEHKAHPTSHFVCEQCA